MDQGQAPTEPVEQPQGFDPSHFFATPETRVDMAQVKPHNCMQNVKQIGRFVHCFDGNHGFGLGPDEMLAQDSAGNFIIQKVKVVKTDKKGRILRS